MAELELSEKAHDITTEQLMRTQAERNQWRELCERLLNEMDAAEWCSPMQEEARELLSKPSLFPVSEHSSAGDKPKVVCFCGSTRFAEYFMIKRWELEKQGIITFGINILPNNYFAEGNAHGAEQEGVKHILDELHKRKIDLSDEVYVLNVGGYIGESTRNEINYAESIGKPIIYLEDKKQQ